MTREKFKAIVCYIPVLTSPLTFYQEEWRKAEGILGELTGHLQRINLHKAVSSTLGKLKAAVEHSFTMIYSVTYLFILNKCFNVFKYGGI